MSNITQVVRTDKNFTTLKKGVFGSGLDQVLSGWGPFTFFAPTDMAFAKLEAETIEDLLKPEGKARLTSLLNQHVVAGKINLKDLIDGDKLQTLAGIPLSVKVAGAKVMIDGATIQHADVKTSNGVIHAVDMVLGN